MNYNVKISIITVVYNGEKYLEQTIKSVLDQSYKNIEYIIIDGGSIDGTIDIIKKNEEKIHYWISEKDNGIYDAMNKGILKATGEIVGIINSDDFYSDNETIENIIKVYTSNNMPDILYGNMKFINPDTNQSKIIYPSINNLRNDMTLNHPACFVKRESYDEKLFDTNFKICADYDLIMFFYLKGKKLVYIDKVITIMRIGGASDNFTLSTSEVFKVQKKYFGLTLAIKNLIVRYSRRFVKNIALLILSNEKIEEIKGFSK